MENTNREAVVDKYFNGLIMWKASAESVTGTNELSGRSLTLASSFKRVRLDQINGRVSQHT